MTAKIAEKREQNEYDTGIILMSAFINVTLHLNKMVYSMYCIFLT